MGTCPPPPPPIILPSEIFLTQYALLSRKLAHKMFIFNKIFRLASLANQDTSSKELYKLKVFKLFHLIYLKRFCVSSKHSEGMQPTTFVFIIQSPSLIFKIIGYNFNTIPVPKSQEKELSYRQSFSSKLVQNITILHIFYQNISGGGPPDPHPSI